MDTKKSKAVLITVEKPFQISEDRPIAVDYTVMFAPCVAGDCAGDVLWAVAMQPDELPDRYLREHSFAVYLSGRLSRVLELRAAGGTQTGKPNVGTKVLKSAVFKDEADAMAFRDRFYRVNSIPR